MPPSCFIILVGSGRGDGVGFGVGLGCLLLIETPSFANQRSEQLYNKQIRFTNTMENHGVFSLEKKGWREDESSRSFRGDSQ